MAKSCVLNVTDTISGAKIDWRTINWRRITRRVRRLQARIAEAVRQGRRGKARALQRILTRSLSGSLLAVRRVTGNSGGTTKGIDGGVWDTPEAKTAGAKSVQKGAYRAQALRRIYIPKKNGKKRPLSIPTIQDRAKQALHQLGLDPFAECLADPNSYGFRRERSAADAIAQCFIVLSQRNSARWILEADIASCFDKISQAWILEHIPMDKGILRKWLKAGYVERKTFHATEEGTPQGSIISPILCNMTLDGLEKRLKERFKRKKINLVRYADDFIVTGPSREFLEQAVLPLIKSYLTERGLQLSEEKTRITHIREGFDFLGQNVRKYGREGKEKLLIRPSKQAVKGVLGKAKEILTKKISSKTVNVIRELNPVLKGWANYHRHVCSKKVFSGIDWKVGRMILKWAKRRHSKKSMDWLQKRYFTDHWVFYGRDEKGREKELIKIGTIPIQRHIKVRGNANPYDPEMETYFEERLAKKWETGYHGKRKLLSLWKRQEGNCPHCGQSLLLEEGTHTHHSIHRVLGGPDTQDNLLLLHPECHRQIHANGVRDTSGSLMGACEMLEPRAGKLACVGS